MPIEAWSIPDEVADQKAENRLTPNQPVSLETLSALGVDHMRFPVPEGVEYPKMSVPWVPDTAFKQDDDLAKMRAEKGMGYADVITIHPDTLPEYDTKVAAFFVEHIHDDDEIRYILEGSGYFDVRAKSGSWIRIACTAGDIITLPKGIYHRYTPDANDFAKVMRLFVGDPVWTPINRGTEVFNEHSPPPLQVWLETR